MVDRERPTDDAPEHLPEARWLELVAMMDDVQLRVDDMRTRLRALAPASTRRRAIAAQPPPLVEPIEMTIHAVPMLSRAL